MSSRMGKVIYHFSGEKLSLAFPLSSETAGRGLRIIQQEKILPYGKQISIFLQPESEITLEELFIEEELIFNKTDKVFLNGYQSWTESREYNINEKMPGLNKLLRPLYRHFHLEYFGDYYFQKYSGKKGNFHGCTYTYIRNADDNTLSFYGSLSEKSGFTVFQYNTPANKILIKKDCAGLKIKEDYQAFDLLISRGPEEKVFENYFKAMNIKKAGVIQRTGWTSWYYYYTNITEEIILENIRAFKDRNIPIDIFQIDDGYQKAGGDWLTVNQKFPGGMKYLAGEIKKAGYQAGIWLAPFICTEDSDIYLHNKDWTIKDDKGSPVIIGYNDSWKSRFYALDFYNPEVREYLRDVFKTVLDDWGFDMVKLDFLYAACVKPGENKTRGQIMSEAAGFLRELAGGRLILGCGVPLGPAFGIFDYCRIGADAGLEWEFKNGAVIRYRERVSTINALVNTIGRRHLSGYAFQNDPDVFILRKDKNTMTADQRQTLFLINLIFGGLIFTSDNINEYSEDEIRIYLSLFPLKEKNITEIKTIDNIYKWRLKPFLYQLIIGAKPYCNVYQIGFEIEGRNYLAFSNLGNKTVSVKLENGIYHNGRADDFMTGGKSISIKPFQSLCLLKIGGHDFEPAGSTGHVFPFCDITGFKIDGDNISLKGAANPMRKSTVYIKVPGDCAGMKVNGTYCGSFEKEGIRLIKTVLNGPI